MGQSTDGIQKPSILVLHHTILFEGLITFLDYKKESFIGDFENYKNSQFVIRSILQVQIENPSIKIATTSQRVLDKLRKRLEEMQYPGVGAYELYKLLETKLGPNKDEQINKLGEDESIVAMAVDMYETGQQTPIPLVSTPSKNNFIECIVRFYQTNKNNTHFKESHIPFNVLDTKEAVGSLKTAYPEITDSVKQSMAKLGLVL